MLRYLPPNFGTSLRCVLLLGCLFSGCFLYIIGVPSAIAGTTGKNILYLNSYHHGYRWSDDITRAIHEVFRADGGRYRIYTEYMDTKRRHSKEMKRHTRSILQLKYPPGFFDLILASDDAAFDFLLESRDELFGATPAVFCGVNFLDRARLAGRKGLLGISEEAKIFDTLDLALRLHPGTRQVFVISDRTTTGLKIRKKVEQVQSRFGNRVTFHMLPDISLEDIGRRLRQLPEDSVVLLGVFSRDSSDNFYEYDEVVPKLVENCPAPIYGLWDFFLGQGIIGGKLTCGYLQGQHLAGLGLKILHGVPAAALPPLSVSQGEFSFDMRQLDRFGIRPEDLPPGSAVVNREHPLASRMRIILLESLIAISVLLGVILLLLRVMKRRKQVQAVLEEDRSALEVEVRARTLHLTEANRQLRMEILERNRWARALQESEQEKSLILNSSSDLIAYLDTDLRIRWANRKSLDLAGRNPEEVEGLPCYVAWHGLEEPCIGCPLIRAEKTGQPETGEVVTPNGKIWLVRAFPFHDGHGRLSGFTSFSLDVTEQKRAQRAMHRLAYYDHLTGLPNRALFKKELDKRLEEAVARGHGLALMFLDLDDFKAVNDSLGHAKGDLLLKEIASRLQGCLGKEDILARLNGDEFIFLLSEVDDPAAVMAIARNVQNIMTRPFHLDGDEIYVGASVGIACYPLHGVDTSNLIKRADRALYAAKGRGRNAIALFSEEINAHFHRRHQLESRLQRALARNEFYLEYQPQVNLRNGQIVGMEALLRWHNGDLGLVMPDDFIPLAEETGLIGPIGEWVLRTACTECLSLLQTGGDSLRLSVNISGYQIKHPDFVTMLDDVLRSTGFDPRMLELEITESVAMNDVEGNVETFGELKARKVLLAIDDFGTGYSSLSYLRNFPIDRLKIDRKFIKDVAECRDSSSLVEAIMGMARSLNLDIIAEGVETTEQVEYLLQGGCLQAQGFLFGRPMSPSDLRHVLRQQDSVSAAAIS